MDLKNSLSIPIIYQIRSKIIFTYIIKKIQTKFKKKLFCVSTGGLSKIISKDINLINTVNENLTIQGLIEIFKLNYNAEIN